jgi:hypothetical protein
MNDQNVVVKEIFFLLNQSLFQMVNTNLLDFSIIKIKQKKNIQSN